jgi:lysozyme
MEARHVNRRLAFAPVLAASLGVAACAGPKAATLDMPERLVPGIFLDEAEPPSISRGAAVRKVGTEGLYVTKSSEGFVGKLYEDQAHFCTIAYGHLVKKARCDGSEPAEFRAGVTEPRGGEILATDMEKAERAVIAAVRVELNDTQYGALCDFVYNVGAGQFIASTLLKVVNSNDFDGVAPQLRRWVKAGGREWPGLRARREREIDLFYQGLARPRAGAPELEPIDIRVGER